jgi:hypothetical protein
MAPFGLPVVLKQVGVGGSALGRALEADDVTKRRTGVFRGAYRVDEYLAGDDGDGAGIAEDVPHLVALEQSVDRPEDCAQLQYPEPYVEVVRAVGQVDGDDVALLDAQRL